jgi:endonuclease/exonuclease/phosphatase family metal-dependent hydrolase
MLLKLLSYNIRFGGQKRRREIAEVIKAVGPDIVIFQEASNTRVIDFISHECDLPFWAARDAHSVGFASRVPVNNHKWHYPPGSTHSFLEVELAESNIRIYGLHLKARFSKWSESQRKREITALLAGIRDNQQGFHVVVGDFNTLAPGEVFNLHLMPLWIRAMIFLSGRDIRRETIQAMLDAGYSDGFRSLYPEDNGYTFPVWEPHVRLDYVFMPENSADRLKSCAIVKSPPIVTTASDHFPLLSEIEIV